MVGFVVNCNELLAPIPDNTGNVFAEFFSVLTRYAGDAFEDSLSRRSATKKESLRAVVCSTGFSLARRHESPDEEPKHDGQLANLKNHCKLADGTLVLWQDQG